MLTIWKSMSFNYWHQEEVGRFSSLKCWPTKSRQGSGFGTYHRRACTYKQELIPGTKTKQNEGRKQQQKQQQQQKYLHLLIFFSIFLSSDYPAQSSTNHRPIIEPHFEQQSWCRVLFSHRMKRFHGLVQILQVIKSWPLNFLYRTLPTVRQP